MAEALQYVGLARRGGNVELGEEKTKALVKSGKARLVIVCSDTSPGALRRAEGYVYGWNVPLLTVPYTKEQLSGIAGRPGCSMAAFRDLGLASAFAQALAGEFGPPYDAAAEALKEKFGEKNPDVKV